MFKHLHKIVVLLFLVLFAYSQVHTTPVKLHLKQYFYKDTLVLEVYAIDTSGSTVPTYNYGNFNILIQFDTSCAYSAYDTTYLPPPSPSNRYPMDSAFFKPYIGSNYNTFYAAANNDSIINVTLVRAGGQDSLSLPKIGPDTTLLFRVFLLRKSCACSDSAKLVTGLGDVITCGDLHYLIDINREQAPADAVDSIKILYPTLVDTSTICNDLQLKSYSNKPGNWDLFVEGWGSSPITSTLLNPPTLDTDTVVVDVVPDIFPSGPTRTDTLIVADYIPGCADTALINVELSTVSIFVPFAVDTFGCDGDTIVFKADSMGINWSVKNGINGDSDIKDQGSNYTLGYDSVLVELFNDIYLPVVDTIIAQYGYCYDTSLVTIGRVDPNFTSSSGFTFCPNTQDVIFTADSSNYDSYQWIISPSGYAWHHFSNTAPKDTVDFGPYTTFSSVIKLIVSDTLGCSDSAQFTFSILNKPKLKLRVFLEGPYVSPLQMTPGVWGLLDSVYKSDSATAIPEGFDDIKMHYDASLQVPNGAVDAIKIQLATDNGNGTYTVVDSAYAWLLQDGTIYDFETGKVPWVSFCNASSGSYYVIVRHRNHLPIISAYPVTITTGISTTANYNFWIPGRVRNYLYETKDDAGVRLMIAGNVSDSTGNKNEVNALDLYKVRQVNGTISKYHRKDVNLDGNVNATDFNITSKNNDELYKSSVDDILTY